MLLESMMEEKQLDFNRPLLSIRRPSSTQPSEPEQKSRSRDSAPKMVTTPPVYQSDIKSGPVRNPGTVPFQWEHKPGKPKDGDKQDLHLQPHFVPKLPPGRTVNVKERKLRRKGETKVAAHTKIGSVRKYESPIAADGAKSSSSRSEYDDCDGEDDSEAYVDAVDGLSRSESFFLNCSVSGVSGLDGQNLNPSGIFASDPQTRDFMMGRFLPAAKALASETPPHPTRKPPLPKEQPSQIKKAVPKMKRHTVQRSPSNFQHLMIQQQERWEESEDEGATVSHKSTVPGVCGLLPQICLKSSFGVLNPVPSVRMQARRAVSVRRLRSNYPNSVHYHENENKHTYGTPQHEKKSALRSQKPETQEEKIKLNTRPNQSAREDEKPKGSVLQEHPQGEALSESFISQGKEKTENFHVGTDNHRTKTSKNFGELLASDDNRWEPCPVSPVPEKTLYVDIVHTVKSPMAEAKVQAKSKSPSPDYQVKGVQGLCGADEKATLQPKSPVQELDGCGDRKASENHGAHSENEAPNKQCDRNHEEVIISQPESVKTKEEKITPPESSNGRHGRLLPPPLPKAPSDSWLKRTLPTMSSKNSLTWTSLGTDNFTKVQAFQISPANPKWETMVKTSNARQGLTHLSKEKLNPIPEA